MLYSRIVGALALTLALWTPTAAQQTAPTPSTEATAVEKRYPVMWRVSDEDSTLWIFGSLHGLPDGADWRGPQFEAVFAEVDIVYFEVRLDFFTNLTSAMSSGDEFTLPYGQTLPELLGEDLWREFSRVSTGYGFHARRFVYARPLAAALTLDSAISMRAGLRANTGVDMIMHAEALGARKDVRYLETHADQLAMLADAPMTVQIALLEAVLERHADEPPLIIRMADHWSNGDHEGLIKAIFESWPDGFYEVIITERNSKWADEFDAFLQGEGDALAIVGAAHMSGEADLIALLQARGYQVERMD